MYTGTNSMKKTGVLLLLFLCIAVGGCANSTSKNPVMTLLEKGDSCLQKGDVRAALDFYNEGFVQITVLQKPSKKLLNELEERLDGIRNEIHIDSMLGNKCNRILPIVGRYANKELDMTLFAWVGDSIAPLDFNKGKAFARFDLDSIRKISVLYTRHLSSANELLIQKINDALSDKIYLTDSIKQTNKEVFYAKSDQSYWAAFKSENIPDFKIISDNNSINTASCLKAICEASELEISTDEIMKIAGLEIDRKTSPKDFISQISDSYLECSIENLQAQSCEKIVSELMKKRFVMALTGSDDPCLVTGISFTMEKGKYIPHKIKIRVPILLEKEEQRVTMDWDLFLKKCDRLVFVNIW